MKKKFKVIKKFNDGNGAILCNECSIIIKTGIGSNQVLCPKCLRNFVYKYKTKYEQGFTNSEIKEMLKLFPVLNKKKFNDAMIGNTCMMIEGDIINYHIDILTALRCGLENRGMAFLEWD